MTSAPPRSEASDLTALLELVARARAWEDALAEQQAGAEGPPPRSRALLPALVAAWALDRRSDGTGDVFSLRSGTAAAALAFGLEPEVLFRQALGRASAPASGRDPGGFPTDLARGLLAPVTMPGTLVEVLAGVALAFRLRGEPRVALLVDDADGAASGFWHEGLNLAAVRRAPLVLVIDSSERRPSTARPERVSVRGPAYGIEARTVDRGEPTDVLAAVREAVAEARAGSGTRLVEVTGRPRDAFEALAGRLQWSETLDAGAAAALLDAARREMADALEGALGDPDPGRADARAPVTPGAEPPGLPFMPPEPAFGG